MKTITKIDPPLQIFLPPPLPLKNCLKFYLMTSHSDSHTTTDVKPEIITGIQTGNGIPHDIYNIRGIVHARTNRKDDIFIQRRLYIDEAHTVLDIFHFAVFFKFIRFMVFKSIICNDYFSYLKKFNFFHKWGMQWGSLKLCTSLKAKKKYDQRRHPSQTGGTGESLLYLLFCCLCLWLHRLLEKS